MSISERNPTQQFDYFIRKNQFSFLVQITVVSHFAAGFDRSLTEGGGGGGGGGALSFVVEAR